MVLSKQPEQASIVKESNNNGQKSILGQLIEQGKNSTKKVGWNDGWEVKEEKKEVHSSTNANQFSNQTTLSQSVYRNQHLNREGFENYRYTRKHVL